MRVKIPNVAAEIHVASTYDTLQLWHERLCHQNKTHVREILKQQGIKVKVDEEFCDGCVYGKQHRESFSYRKNRPTKKSRLEGLDILFALKMTFQSLDGFSFYRQNLRLQIACQSL